MKFSKEQPIYVQLAENIKINIINGSFAEGEKLPSIREYSEKMIVNPNTTQRAFRELELEKFIVGKSGLGYYVNEDKEELKKLKREYLYKEIKTFLDKMTKLNFTKEEIIEKIKEIL